MKPWTATSLLFALLIALPAAAETVHFPSAIAPPSPLRQRLARENGQPIVIPPAAGLAGELYRPAGDGPFPAVVQLHGCSGRGPSASEDAAGAHMVALGYVLLIVDSFGPRGVTSRCGADYWTHPVDRVGDAYGALAWLAAQPFVDPGRIALLGYSQGAMVALSAVSKGGEEGLYDGTFRTVIAYYPYCGVGSGTVSTPTLILIGERDQWTPAEACRRMMAQRSGAGASMRLVVYPDAHHGFDAESLRDRPIDYLGYRIEYNEAAARAAWAEATSALRQAFGR